MESSTCERVDRWVGEAARPEAVVGTALIDEREDRGPLRGAGAGASYNEKGRNAQQVLLATSTPRESPRQETSGVVLDDSLIALDTKALGRASWVRHR